MNIPAPIASVVIPAHEEEAVIGRCLDALFTGIEPGELEVIVVCNGCRDATAQVARAGGHPVVVLELQTGSKPLALRTGDLAAHAATRLYLDADVILPGSSARQVALRLQAGVPAARPAVAYDTAGSSWLVRRYYRARSRMPSLLGSLWGAGVYGLSGDGRARFDVFPDLIGDDLFVDRLFQRREVEIVDCDPVVVTVPRRARDLLAVLRRIYRGNAQPMAQDPDAPQPPGTTDRTLQDLRRLARTGPGGAIDAAVFMAFAVGARVQLAVGAATGRTAADRWERDDSSRVVAR